jgi:hypothetical protein
MAALIATCGADTASLPICVSHEGPLDTAALREWARKRYDRNIYLFDPTFADDVSETARRGFEPGEGVLVAESYSEPPSW